MLAPELECGFPTRSFSPSRSAALWYHPWKDAAGHVSEHAGDPEFSVQEGGGHIGGQGAVLPVWDL